MAKQQRIHIRRSFLITKNNEIHKCFEAVNSTDWMFYVTCKTVKKKYNYQGTQHRKTYT